MSRRSLQAELDALSPSDCWRTPPEVMEVVNALSGVTGFYDPCPSQPTENGLEVDWYTRTVPPRPSQAALVFCNPPYSRVALRRWVEKCHQEGNRGAQVLALIPASVGAQWWVEHVWHGADMLCFVRGRLRFVPPSGEPSSGCGRFWSAFVLWSARDALREKFTELASGLGECARLRVAP